MSNKSLVLRILSGVCFCAVIVFFSGCASDPRLARDTLYFGDSPDAMVGQDRGRMDFDNVSYWDGDSVSGKPSVQIRLTEQRAYFYKGRTLVGISSISTGREGFNTPVGNFHIIQKDKDHVSSRFGDFLDASTREVIKKDADLSVDKLPKGAIFDAAKMPYFMRIVGGTGMHEGFLPGYPASHGCIRMPGFMAEAFFRSLSVGTPVEIAR